jgi:hypothetical protein
MSISVLIFQTPPWTSYSKPRKICSLSLFSPYPVTRNKFSVEPRFLLGIARIYDALNDPNNAIIYYKKVLALDSSNVESIACLGAHFFYSDQVSHSLCLSLS